MTKFIKSLQFILVLLSLLGYFSHYHYILDITSHFKFQYFIFSFLFLLFFLYKKNNLFVFISLIIVCLNFYEISNYLPIQKSIKSDSVKVMSYNVLSQNYNYQALIDLVDKEKPDILMLQEIDFNWNYNLVDLYSKYKNVYIASDSQNGANVLLTNYPVTYKEIKQYDPDKRLPSIKINISINKNEYTIIGSHPLNPSKQEHFLSRDKFLFNIVNDPNFKKEKTIIIGDLNTSMFSNGYKRFENKGNLKNTREGFGIGNTWSTVPIMFLFQTPIDHIVVTEDIKVNNFRVLPNIGSDHLPIIAELEL